MINRLGRTLAQVILGDRRGAKVSVHASKWGAETAVPARSSSRTASGLPGSYGRTPAFTRQVFRRVRRRIFRPIPAERALPLNLNQCVLESVRSSAAGNTARADLAFRFGM